LNEYASFDVLIDKICPVVSAGGDDKKGREGQGRDGKGRYTKLEDVIFQLSVGQTPPPSIPIKFCMHVVTHDVNKTGFHIYRVSKSPFSR